MSQIEQRFRQLLSRYPEIEKCYQKGLINRRSLARYLIREGLAKNNQLEAVIAMLRRFEFKDEKEDNGKFRNVRANIKDKILILDFEKNKELLQKLRNIIAHTDYDKGDTLKIVVGSSSIKIFIDQKNESKLNQIIEDYNLKKKYKDISEISLMFYDKAINTKGIISTITRQFAINDISVVEMLTATPELILYVKESDVIKAYEVIKQLER